MCFFYLEAQEGTHHILCITLIRSALNNHYSTQGNEVKYSFFLSCLVFVELSLLLSPIHIFALAASSSQSNLLPHRGAEVISPDPLQHHWPRLQDQVSHTHTHTDSPLQLCKAARATEPISLSLCQKLKQCFPTLFTGLFTTPVNCL